MKKFTVTERTNLKDFTDAVFPQGGFYLRILLKKGDVRVNGTKIKENVPLSAGDEVAYYTTAAQEGKPSHDIVYEDDNLLIADKYSGVTSEGLFYELSPLIPVHRLDRNTEGLIVLAKSQHIADELISAFKERKVEKTYLCVAKNAFASRSAKLHGYLKKDAQKARVSVYDRDIGGCEGIFTEYRVIEELGDVALVEVTLHTGKTHQIRAHLAHIGCPVLGDEKYGDGTLNKKYGVKRQLLVAKYLRFSVGGDLDYLGGRVFESRFSPILPSRGD